MFYFSESQGWKTSLSSDKIKNMKCIQKLREANKVWKHQMSCVVDGIYRKVPKFWDARIFCCNLPKIKT